MIERLTARTGNPYGKAPGDMDRILGDLAAVEPLLRKAADHEICTTTPLTTWWRRYCTWPASLRTAITRPSRAPTEHLS